MTQQIPTLGQQLVALAVAETVVQDYDKSAKTMRSIATQRFIDEFSRDHNKSKIVMHGDVKLGVATITEDKDKAAVEDEDALIAWLEEVNPEAIEYKPTIRPNVLKKLLDPKFLLLGEATGSPVSNLDGEPIPGLITKKASAPTKFSITQRNADALRELASTFDVEQLEALQVLPEIEAGATIAGETVAEDAPNEVPGLPGVEVTGDLDTLLDRACRVATGDLLVEVEPGVIRAEAIAAAWHATAIQGGYSTPEVEAKRLSADRAGDAASDDEFADVPRDF